MSWKKFYDSIQSAEEEESFEVVLRSPVVQRRGRSGKVSYVRKNQKQYQEVDSSQRGESRAFVMKSVLEDPEILNAKKGQVISSNGDVLGAIQNSLDEKVPDSWKPYLEVRDATS